MHVLVTGASGLIGGALSKALIARGDAVTGISRSPAARQADGVSWAGWGDLEDVVAAVDAAVHLAGADLAAKRWSTRRKRELREGRIGTAQRLADAIRTATAKPSMLVSTSAVGYYGSRGDEELTESSPPGADFLARLCQEWEAAAGPSGVRTVLLRNGVVLARDGGALPRLARPFRFGVGGPLGRGRHYMAWVHLDDVVGVILHALDNDSVSGPLNVTAPQPVTNAAFTKALGRVLHRPAILPVPPLALRLALGEVVPVVLMASQRALPQRTQASGYTFRHPTLEGALQDLLG